MGKRNRSDLLRSLDRLFTKGTIPASDEELLLERFASHREEAAFEALLRRHGPMVLSLCRRMVANSHDAEDAFQATFLVLARRAGSIRNPAVLSSWLYGVAYKVATRTRAVARRARTLPEEEFRAIPAGEPPDALERQELRALLDEEIDRLSDRDRTLVVLHYLEGRTHEQIARQMLCPIGTVHSRLTRVRDRLRARLVRRGVAVGVARLDSTTPPGEDPAALSPALVSATARAAALYCGGRTIDNVVASPVAILVKQTLRTLAMRMLRSAACASLALALLMTGAGVLAFQAADGPRAGDRPAAASQSALERMAADQVSPYELRMAGAGDPREAPEGLVAVLGNSRLKHWSYVGNVTFSPDGALIGSVSPDGTARIWDAASGDERLRLHARPMWEHGSQGLSCIAFSPDGRTVAAGGSNNAVILWDVATGRERLVLKGDQAVCSLAFHPNGRHLATGQEMDAAIWDVNTGDRLQTFAGYTSSFRRRSTTDHVTVAFTPDGQSLIAGHPDGKVRYWDPETGRLLRTLEAHGTVTAVSISPDGALLATGGKDGKVGNVRVWDAASGSPRRTIEGAHEQYVQDVTFRPDGILASGGLDGRVKYWDPATGNELKSFKASQGVGVESLAFNRAGTVLVSAGPAVRAWDAESGRRLLQTSGHEGQTKSAAFLNGGRLLATCGGDGLLKVWDLATRRAERTIDASDSLVMSVAPSPDGATLATVGFSGKSVRLWETATGRLRTMFRLSELQGFGQAVTYSPDGRWLAVSTRRRPEGMHVVVWNINTGKTLGELDAAQGTVLFTSDGERLIVAGQTYVGPGFQTRLSVWTVPDLKQAVQFDNFEGMSQLWGAAISGDDRTLALAGSIYGPDDAGRRVVILWDLQRQRRRLVLDHGEDAIDGLEFAPDRLSLVSFASRAGKVRVWDPRDGSLRQTVAYPDAGYWRIMGAAFAPDSRHVATAMGNGTTYLLRIQPPREGVEELAIVAPGPPTPDPPRTDFWRELIGKPAPEFQQLKGWAFGEPVTMADLRGRPVLLHFWNVGSEYRMPALMRLHRQYAAKGLVIVVVLRDWPGATVDGISKIFDRYSHDWQDQKLPFRVALDGAGETPIDGTPLKAPGATDAAYRILYARRGWVVPPVEVLVGPDGRILSAMASSTGFPTPIELERLLGQPDLARSGSELARIYALDDDQVLKRVGPPYPPARAEYFLDRLDARELEFTHLFQYDGTLSRSITTTTQHQLNLRGTLGFVVGLKSFEFAGPDDLLAALVPPGDWVRRTGATRERLLDGLGSILRRDAALSVKFELREVEREVIVATGHYEFHAAGDGDGAKSVHLFSGSNVPQSRFGGGGTGTLRKLLDWVGELVDRAIIDESDSPADLTMSWRDHVSGAESARDRDTADRLLENLAKQTSLRFRREQRKVGVWFVVRDGP